MIRLSRCAPGLLALLVAVALAGGAPARAASGCPTQTFLSYDHLAYIAVAIPGAVQIPPGAGLGAGTVDAPTSANGCRRTQTAVQIQRAASIQPAVAVLARGRPRTLFVIGHRCDGFAGPSYWDCLLRPLAFQGQAFTATSYPAAPAPRRTLALGAPIGTAIYQGEKVTVRRIQGVSPALAVGVSGRPSTAFLSPRVCPYSGFSNNPQYDDLLRCLRSAVWYTFDPPGSEVGGTVVGRSDRAISTVVAGASIGLLPLPVVADFVPRHHGSPAPVGHVSEQVRLRVPDVPAGLYEAVVSCPRCSPAAGGAGLYPAGSILVEAKPKTSPGIKIVSYALAAVFVVASILAFMTWRRRRRLRAGGPGPGPGPGAGRSSRR